MTDDFDVKLREARQAADARARQDRLVDELPELERQAKERARRAEAQQAIEAIRANIEKNTPVLKEAKAARDQVLHDFIQMYLSLVSRSGALQDIHEKVSYDFRQLAYYSLIARGEIEPGMSIALQENLLETESARLKAEMGLARPIRFSSFADNNTDVQRLLAFLEKVLGLDYMTTQVVRENIDHYRKDHDGLTLREKMRQASMNPSNGDAKLFEP